jgi:lambda family phage portal protein
MTASPRKRKTLATEFDAIRADYDMSRESRFIRRRQGLAPRGGSADFHYRTEEFYYRDIEKARDMDRNDAIVGQTIDRAVANIVQDGFTLDVRTGDSQLDLELWQRWQDWSSNADACDMAGEFTWQDIERHVMRSMLLDGDIVALGTAGGQLQMIEAHSIQTITPQENTFLGVTRDAYGRRTQYWYSADKRTGGVLAVVGNQKETAEPISVRDENGDRVLFHVYNPRRVNQTRGVTALAPIFSVAGMFEDINFAKLVQQQVVSCFAIFRKRNAIAGGGPLPSTDGYGLPQTESTGQGTRYIENIGPGMEIIGAEGEELQGFSPNVPNAEFFTHVKLMLQIIGVNLGLPLCLVLMDGSETNFSGWRGAVDEARKGFKTNQTNLQNRLHRPVYEFKLRQWIAEDRALQAAAKASGIDIFGHRWNAPTWQYIDPVSDAQGDALRIQNALTSPRRLHAEGGRDWEEIADEIVADMSYAIVKAKQRAVAINSQFQDNAPVHWRELISLPMPNGIQMTMQDPQAAVVAADAASDADQPQQPTGEYKDISRQQWNRNRKAIRDIQNDLAAGQMQAGEAEVMLEMLGLSPGNIKKLIGDTADGSVDIPAEEFDENAV